MKLAAIKEKIAQLDKRLPRRQTVMLPSEAFFCRFADIPEGTKKEDIGNFAQLQLEAAAPFPIENLAWGFIQGSNRKILIYAATSDRATAGLENKLETYWHVLPSFLPFCLRDSPVTDVVQICIAGNSASALWFKAGFALPIKIQSCRIPDETPRASDGDIIKLRAELLDGLGVDKTQNVEQGVLMLDSVSCTHEKKVIFKIRRINDDGTSSHLQEVSIENDSLWNADARGIAFATATSKERHQAYVTWLAFAGACGTAAVLAIATLTLVCMNFATAYYHLAARTNLDEVEVLQNKSDFATNLESVTERELKPFSMLAKANADRPKGVYFERASSSDWNVLHLEGQAQRSEQIQNYIEALTKNSSVSAVRTLRTTTSGGHSTFDIEVVFNNIEDISTAN